MPKKKYKTKDEIHEKSLSFIGKTFAEIDKYDRISQNKGSLGSIIEESGFGYSINSESKPDFEEVGLELKVTPFLRSSKGVRAKERLVCGIINYMEEYKKNFSTSSFLAKCANMLIILYEHRRGINKGDFMIEKSFLYDIPQKDRLIMENDYNLIRQKILDGKAHEISEGDTLYLGACTKGKNKHSLRPQPFSDILAMQRAFSLKYSYMSNLIKNIFYQDEYSEQIITDDSQLKEKSITSIIESMFEPYFGKSQAEIKAMLGITTSPKHLNRIIVSKILHVNDAENSEEFKKANITIKTIRLETDRKRIKENMSFPAFKFKDIVNQEFEESDFYNQVVNQKFMFVIYAKDEFYDKAPKHEKESHLFLKRIMFWQLPEDDINTVKMGWEKTKEVIQQGVKLEISKWGNRTRINNNLPKPSDNRIIHVRPHERKAAYRIGNTIIGDLTHADILPNGNMMTTQSFWFNNSYLAEVISKQDDYEKIKETSS